MRVDGRTVRNAAARVDPARARITVDGEPVVAERKVYLMLNKPRGLVTTRDDPQERATVYDCRRSTSRSSRPWDGSTRRARGCCS